MNERAHTSKLSPSIYDAPLFFFYVVSFAESCCCVRLKG